MSLWNDFLAYFEVVSTPVQPVHLVLASTFADPADVEAYKRALAEGKTEEEALAIGDNAIGCWDNPTGVGSGPQCALPPEDWEHLAKPHGTAVLVRIGGKSALAKLGDTMPHKANIKNGAGIDMNPDLCAKLGVSPGGMYRASWQYA